MIVTRGLVWPLLLIVAGVTFLLANFGYIPPFHIGRAIGVLWPLVLVLVGIDLALSRRMPGAALGLQVLAIVVGLGVLATRPDIASGAGFRGPVAQAVSVERGTSTTATMRFQVGAGRFELAGGATALLEWDGCTVNTVEGEPDNFKITTEEDLARAEAVLAARRSHSRG